MNRIIKLFSLATPALAYLLLMSGAVTYSPPAMAMNGKCKWENGPGTDASCLWEDCLEDGGNMLCSEPEIAPSIGAGDAQVDGQKFGYGMCDMAGPSIPAIAAWCTAEGGTWNGPDAPCAGLPPEYPGIGRAASEGSADAASDIWIQRRYSTCTTSPSDSGWGFNNTGDQLCGGQRTLQNQQVISDVKQRHYTITCPTGQTSTFDIKVRKDRRMICPHFSRTKPNGDLQCTSACTRCGPKVGNPVDIVTGDKTHKDTDYASADGLVFTRYYDSRRHWRPLGTGAFVPGPPDYWRSTFSRKIWPFSGVYNVMAVVEEDDGNLVSFNANGKEIRNENGAAATLQNLGASGWKLTRPDYSVEMFDASGRFVSATMRSGVAQTVTRDAGGRIASITNSFGRTLSLTYIGGQLTALTIPGGLQIAYGYDAAGRLETATYADGAVKRYVYADPINKWLLTGLIDENGRTFATYTYDTYSRVITEERAGAEKYTFSYPSPAPAPEMTIQLVDPLGKGRSYTMTMAQGVFKTRTVSAYCPSCPNIGNATFDANGNYASKYDLSGRGATYVYDLSRNLQTSRTEGSGVAARTISTSWHPTYRLPASESVYAGSSATGTPLRTTSYTYDSAGNTLTRTVSDPAASSSRTWTYTYDSLGHLLTSDGPRTDVSDVTTYTYYNCVTGSECGQPQTVTNASGHVTTYNSYNAHGQPTLITDPNGLQTQFTYDNRQRLVTRVTAYGTASAETMTLEFWPTGLPKKVIRSDNSYVLYTYDDAHRLVRAEDGSGGKQEYILDGSGNRQTTNSYDPYGTLVRTQRQLYNEFGQLWQQLSASGLDSEATVLTYDQSGNQTGSSAPLGRVTGQVYDELKRLKQFVDPAGAAMSFGYDATNNLTQVTDPRSLVTSYQYNGLGDLKQVTSPDAGTSTITYDSGGNALTSTNARSAVQTNTYDALNRLLTTSYKIGATTDQSLTFTYDTGLNGVGQLTAASDANHSLTFSYDALGRVTNKTQTVGGNTKTVVYGYASGRPTSLLTPSGQSIAYSYDSVGRLSGITLNGATLLNNIVHDPFGPITGWTWGNNSLTVRNFDLDGRMDLVDSAGLSTYTFFADNSIAGRLDDSVNSYSLGAGSTTLTPSSTSNRLTSTSGVLQRAYSYDAAGNTTSDGTTNYTYNFANRMASASRSGVTATYTYNALGQRVRKQVGAATTFFFYDELGHLLGEYNGAGLLIEEIVWLGDIPVATIRPNGAGVQVFYIHTDHLNTPRRVTRPSDNVVVWRWDSDPFGEAVANDNPDGDASAFAFQLRFPGQFRDDESGLNYNYFRDYDPAVGRYAESDPIGLKGGWNTFSYVGNSPLRFGDPFGLKVECQIVASTTDNEVVPIHRDKSWDGPQVKTIGPGPDGGHLGLGAEPKFPSPMNPRGGMNPSVDVPIYIWNVHWHHYWYEDGYKWRRVRNGWSDCRETDPCKMPNEYSVQFKNPLFDWKEVVKEKKWDELFYDGIWGRTSAPVPIEF
jgi:RHS repeat-associated protein